MAAGEQVTSSWFAAKRKKPLLVTRDGGKRLPHKRGRQSLYLPHWEMETPMMVKAGRW